MAVWYGPTLICITLMRIQCGRLQCALLRIIMRIVDQCGQALIGHQPIEYQVFPNIFLLLHCVPLYVCRLCINFQDLCARLLGMAALRILLLTFTSRFVIDFLSIRKVIIFSATATDDRHPLRSRSIHQNAANCMTIRYRYIAQPRGVRKTYCARSRNDVRRLTSRSNGMPSKKIMESLKTFIFVETVLRRGRMLQGSDGVQNPLIYHAE